MITVRAGPGCIEVTGHANYAPPGFDIVCAAVSTLVDTLVASVEDLTDDRIKEDLQPGRAVIRYGDLSARGRLLVDSFFVGVKGVAGVYPDRVEVI